jgi:hypothetical protein
MSLCGRRRTRATHWRSSLCSAWRRRPLPTATSRMIARSLHTAHLARQLLDDVCDCGRAAARTLCRRHRAPRNAAGRRLGDRLVLWPHRRDRRGQHGVQGSHRLQGRAHRAGDCHRRRHRLRHLGQAFVVAVDGIAFIVYLAVDEPTPYFAIVIMFTELLPIALVATLVTPRYRSTSSVATSTARSMPSGLTTFSY